MTLGMEVGLDPVHIVLDGDTAPLPKKATEPSTIGPSLLWPNGWMHQHMPLGMEVRLSPCDFVLDGDPATSEGAEPTQFSTQTAAWIKIPLGTEVGLSLRDIVFDVQTQLQPEKRAHPPSPIFGPCLLWPNGWMDEL